MSAWKVSVTKLRNRRGRLRTDFGARIIACRLTSYVQAQMDAQDDGRILLDLATQGMWKGRIVTP